MMLLVCQDGSLVPTRPTDIEQEIHRQRLATAKAEQEAKEAAAAAAAAEKKKKAAAAKKPKKKTGTAGGKAAGKKEKKKSKAEKAKDLTTPGLHVSSLAICRLR